MQETYKKTAIDTLSIGLVTVLQFLIGLIQLPLLTKTLGTHDYGIWTQVHTTVNLILPFTNLGLSGAMIRFLAAEKNKEEIQEGFYSVLVVLFGINLLVSLLVILLADPLAQNFFSGATQIVRITGILILFNPINLLYFGLIRAFRHIKTYSVIIIVQSIVQLGIIAYLVLSGFGLLDVVYSVLVIKLITFMVLFFLIKSQIGIIIPRFTRIKKYLDFGLPLIPKGLAFWLVMLSDRYVIAYFLGATSLGTYSAAYGIGRMPYPVLAILSFVLLPTLAKLYDEGRITEVTTHLSYTIKYFLAIAIPFTFGAALLAEPILTMFTNAEIARAGRFVLPLIALSILLLGVHNIINNVLILTKRTKIMAVTWIVAAALNIGLNILVVPVIGIIGAAITTLMAYSLGLGIISYYSFKELKFPFGWPFIGKSIASSATMSVLVWIMAPQDKSDIFLTIAVAVLMYGAVLILLRGFTINEFIFFKSLARKK